MTVVNGKFGLILQQRVYDARNQLVGTSTTGRYRRDPATGLFMPTVVQISTPAKGTSPAFTMELQLGNVEINTLAAGTGQLWAMPNYENSPPVDICRTAARACRPGAVTASHRPGPSGRICTCRAPSIRVMAASFLVMNGTLSRTIARRSLLA